MDRGNKPQDESVGREILAALLGPTSPPPAECPDCGSRAFVPIRYGLPGPEMRERSRRGEIVLGGCCVHTPRWHCRDCFCDWPEDPPPPVSSGISPWERRALPEAAAEYASLTAAASLPCQPDEPSVENFWERPDGRTFFLVRFAWGRMRIGKSLHLLPHGGPPVYECVTGFPFERPDFARARRLAALAAVRFEQRPSA